MREFIIGKNEAGQRFDKYLLKLLKNAGTGLLYKQLRNKNIVLNGKKAKGNEILCEKDIVRVFMADSTIDKFMGTADISYISDMNTGELLLKVVYEDENIILADKPEGVLAQQADKNRASMNEYLIKYLLENGFDEKELVTFKPAFCNRLDRNTTGMMAGGKSLAGLQVISELIRNRSLDKYYLAIVAGTITDKKYITGYLRKDEKNNSVTVKPDFFPDSEEIHTEYEPMGMISDERGSLTLLNVKLITGKTHQIRAHLASVGHPVLGDPKYGNPDINKKYNENKQMLHSYRLVFPQIQGELSYLSHKEFKTEFPDRFKKYFKELYNG